MRGEGEAVDPVDVALVRSGLLSAARQMQRALIRTSFTPVVYEVLDFAAVIYDRHYRLLAQAPSLITFMGTMSFCIEAAVESVGGESELEPGDVILLNDPYLTGSHAQDAAVVMPIFMPEHGLVGYSAIKAHWADIGAKNRYCTDTVDLFQEGMLLPGVKLYSRGERNEDIMRILRANSRLPRDVEGDLNAEIVGVRVAAAALCRVIERFGMPTFEAAVEAMFDHGEATVRSYLAKIPDGRYVGHGQIDSDGISDEAIPFDVGLEVEGDRCRLDLSGAPDSRGGPMNCPVPTTVSACRVAITALVGGGEALNEGFFRPLEIITRPGSIFHPLRPSPCFMGSWPGMQAADAAIHAVAQAIPERLVAEAGGDIAGTGFWGYREETGEGWLMGGAFPTGQGASARGDGASALIHWMQGATRVTPCEVMEAKAPIVLDRYELDPDSGGAGQYRGGLGVVFLFRLTETCEGINMLERAKNPAKGLLGGAEGRPGSGEIIAPDGSTRSVQKETGYWFTPGARFHWRTAGGAGYGPPEERDPAAVREDLRQGFISEEAARADYPHAFSGDGGGA
ncbi:MAG: hydantoinase B/oxoprolinase family protein [Actinobacteria bacterium]|nr:hydantoinase B/oxoprolinase family protein [Actinomycetota bacterium]